MGFIFPHFCLRCSCPPTAWSCPARGLSDLQKSVLQAPASLPASPGLTWAPFSSNTFAQATCPPRQASWRADTRSVVIRFTSKPCEGGLGVWEKVHGLVGLMLFSASVLVPKDGDRVKEDGRASCVSCFLYFTMCGQLHRRHHVSLTYKGGIPSPIKASTRSYSWWDSAPWTGTTLVQVSAAQLEPSAPSVRINRLLSGMTHPVLKQLFLLGQTNCVRKVLQLTVWGAQFVSLRGGKYNGRQIPPTNLFLLLDHPNTFYIGGKEMWFTNNSLQVLA